MRVFEIDVEKLLFHFEIDYTIKGKRCKACCPSHEDKSPSWSMELRTGRHYCFSCGFGGTIISFVRGLVAEGLCWSPRECIDWLESNGMLIGGKDAVNPLSVSLFLREQNAMETPKLRLPTLIRFEDINDWPSPCRNYLFARGVTVQQAREWRVGYCVDGRLAGRIVFVVRDAKGVACTYSARTFLNDEIRYLTPIANENPDVLALFGEEFWPDAFEQARSTLILAEGALDVLAIERALSCREKDIYFGGVLGVKHLENPKMHTKFAYWKRIVLFLDNDRAGNEVAEVLQKTLSRACQVLRVVLKEGRDATDSSSQEIQAAYNHAIRR